ncbi:MAG: hypothetical protein MGG11_21865 [Trichodesmium sp. MAG_R03]|nr:hypothetical protein [Trichodesmium sp. MAG_R03]
MSPYSPMIRFYRLSPTGLTHGHYTRVRVNAIRPYIWGFQGEAWASPDQYMP